MTGPALRLSLYDIASGQAPFAIAVGGTRFVFATAGALQIARPHQQSRLEANDGCFIEGPFDVAGTGWLFECTAREQPLLSAAGANIVLSQPIDVDFAAPYLLRADRVASDPGAETPVHFHRGPGIRRLLTGRILASIGDTTERLEAGRDPVVGRNIHSGENIFIRVMLLPAELRGGVSSFVPASPEEAKRPRAARYRIFGEQAFSQ